MDSYMYIYKKYYHYYYYYIHDIVIQLTTEELN